MVRESYSGAGVAELADADVSQTFGRTPVWVRLPPPVPTALHDEFVLAIVNEII